MVSGCSVGWDVLRASSVTVDKLRRSSQEERNVFIGQTFSAYKLQPPMNVALGFSWLGASYSGIDLLPYGHLHASIIHTQLYYKTDYGEDKSRAPINVKMR